MRIAILAATIVLAAANPAAAGQNYPPYPDVWGRELKPDEGAHWYSAYDQSNGDIALLFQKVPDQFPSQRIDFFQE